MKEQKTNQGFFSVCGTDCGTCDCFGKMCNGCNSCEGKVFHAPEGSACPIYDCVRNDRGCKIVGNVEKFHVKYGLIPEILSFQMKNLTKI